MLDLVSEYSDFGNGQETTESCSFASVEDSVGFRNDIGESEVELPEESFIVGLLISLLKPHDLITFCTGPNRRNRLPRSTHTR